MTKQKVVVLYGGRSTEHEISKRSARFIFDYLDDDKYEVIPIGITKSGRWCLQKLDSIRSQRGSLVGLEETQHNISLVDLTLVKPDQEQPVVVFPILHGTYGEDGCTQGFLELNSLAFVGPGVLGSALAMDKVVAKTLVAAAGIPVVPSVHFRREQWLQNADNIVDRIQTELKFPLYVKPANLGSSVGISRVESLDELQPAIQEALSFDTKILVETGLDVREIEFAALGGYSPKISSPGEVVATTKYYSYDSKYEDPDASKIIIPAPMSDQLRQQGQDLARKVFEVLNLYGMARLDFFLEKNSQTFYFNEANTLPGMTSISQYPKLWLHEGLTGTELLDQLVDTAVDRWQQQKALRRSYGQ